MFAEKVWHLGKSWVLEISIGYSKETTEKKEKFHFAYWKSCENYYTLQPGLQEVHYKRFFHLDQQN